MPGRRQIAERSRQRILVRKLLIVAAVLCTSGLARSARDAQAAATIEDTYRATGPWAVSTGSVTAFDGGYQLFYPTELGKGGVRHPILTWGNGTGGKPANYTALLTHLASWGFVVIASDSGQTGLGTEILDGAYALVNADDDPSSIFYHTLDVAHVGALGHSQGAGGTLNATIDSDGLISSAVTIALPDPIFWTTPVPNMARFPASAAIFFIHGTIDPLATEAAATRWYDPVPGVAAKASQKDAGHNQVQIPTTRLTGYVTAWLLYTLRGDRGAGAAFFGSPAEIDGNDAWQDTDQKTPAGGSLAGPVCPGAGLAPRSAHTFRLPALRAGAHEPCP